MNGKIEMRPIKRNEWEMAMQLAWDTFLEFEAPIYEPEGVKNFHEFVKGKELKQLFLLDEYVVYGAFVDKIIVGIAGIRKIDHISLLFVDSRYQHKGIGTNLLYMAFNEAKLKAKERMTVNSSPIAVKFYHNLGFVDLSRELSTDGIRYTPMRIELM